MNIAILSADFKLEVPLSIREQLKLSPGDKFQIFGVGGRLEFVPIRPIQEMRGFLHGISPDIEREEDRLL